jgi:2,4-dienoyl-CoA reductase-like NADH-dependent reductase (Old Yellow Enzyme family)
LNGLELPNRIIKAATYEGMAPQGKPTPQLIEFHRRIAAGGTALTTLAYYAPEPDGRLAPGTQTRHEIGRPVAL